MKVRYTGPEDEKALAFPGGFVLFPRLKWVDVEKALDEALIDQHHLQIVVDGLGAEWEVDRSRKQRTKAPTRKPDTAPAPTPPEDAEASQEVDQ